MEPIVAKYEWFRKTDNRWYVTLHDGRQIPRSRLVMMNHLHTNSIPTQIHVHHGDEDTQNDSPGNLRIIRNGHHVSLHVNPMGIPSEVLRQFNLIKYNNSPEAKERTSKWRADNSSHLTEYFRNYYGIHKDEINRKRREKRRSNA
jgi:hypothetical protein